MQKQDKETDLAITRLFHTYLDSIKEKPMGKVLGLTIMNMIRKIVQTRGKQQAVILVEEWSQAMDDEVADPERLPALLRFIEDCEKEGKKETS